MKLVDTHCHIYDSRFDEDLEQVIARALESLEWLVIVGDDIPNSRKVVSMVQDRVFAAVGFHPYHADHVNPETMGALRELASQQGVVALGEMGLDYFKYAETSPQEQRQAFEAQLELAADLRLPVIIHNREADDDTAKIMDNAHESLAGSIMHCFGSDAKFAEKCLEWGCYISFAGNVTFPKAESLREAAAVVPLDRLLVETDSPYLAPQKKRGKRCEPAYVQYTAECLSEIKGVSLEEFSEATTKNATRLLR